MCSTGRRPGGTSPTSCTSATSTSLIPPTNGAESGTRPCRGQGSTSRREAQAQGGQAEKNGSMTSAGAAPGPPSDLSLTSLMHLQAAHPPSAPGRPRPRGQRRSASTPKQQTGIEGPGRETWQGQAPATSARFSSPLPSEARINQPQDSGRDGVTAELRPYDRSQSFGDTRGCSAPPGSDLEAKCRQPLPGWVGPTREGAHCESGIGRATPRTRERTPLAALRTEEAEEEPLSSTGSADALSLVAPRPHNAAKGVKVSALLHRLLWSKGGSSHLAVHELCALPALERTC